MGREVTEKEGAVCMSCHAKGQGKMTVWLMHSGITHCTHKCEPHNMYTYTKNNKESYNQPEAHNQRHTLTHKQRCTYVCMHRHAEVPTLTAAMLLFIPWSISSMSIGLDRAAIRSAYTRPTAHTPTPTEYHQISTTCSTI